MKTILTLTDLATALTSHLQSVARPGEIISVENLGFHLNGDDVLVDKISFGTKITLPKRGRPATRRLKLETSIPRYELLLRKVTSFNLPTSTQHSLENANVLYVWQLAVLSDKALHHWVSGIGKVSIRKIRERLAEIPDFDEGTEISFRNRFFRRIFSIKPSEVKTPREELNMIVRLKDERLEEVEGFIRSTVAV